MKANLLLITATLLTATNISYSLIEKPVTREEFKQKVQQQQGKIEDLEALVATQKKQIIDSRRTIGRAKKAYKWIKKQLDEKEKENKRLKILCKQAGINTAKIADTSFSPNDIVYRGRKCSQKWFDKMYEKFCGKIICVDGKYIDVKESKKKATYLRGKANYPKGSIVAIPNRSWTVLQALGNGEALITQEGIGVRSSNFSYREPDLLFHLSGYQSQLTDNQTISLKGHLISMGTFEYINTSGAKNTIQSFTIFQEHESLTREQFADAIKSGFELVN